MKNQSRKRFRIHKRAMTAAILLSLLWQGPAPAAWLSGTEVVQAAESGTESDPIQIDTVQELKEIADGLDKHYVLARDIVLDSATYWRPIGTAELPFTGSLDGKGHRIKNLTMIAPVNYLGLFAYISNAQIKNLILENTNVQGESYSSALAGYVVGASKIENCSVSGIVKGNQYVGGLIGCFDGGELLNSNNSADITARSTAAGGLAGGMTSGNISIRNSFNLGAVTGTGCTGGVLGYQSGGSSELSTVYNTGKVRGTGDGSGGIVGYVVSNCLIEEAANLAEVQGTNSVGGIAGYFATNIEITNAYNRGNVIGTGTGNYSGGIVGYMNATAGGVRSCYSTGDVTAYSYAGGLIGYRYSGGLANSFAMNDRVTVAYTGGYRISGTVYHAGESSNMAFEDMVVTVGGAVREIKGTNPIHSSQDGMNGAKATVMQNSSYLELLGWDFENIWQVAEDGKDYPKLRNVNLTPPVHNVSVTGVSLDKQARTLQVGETAALKAAVTPSDATNRLLHWSSSQTDIVRVSDTGTVTAIAAGSAAVTVRTADGNFTAGCEITVVEESGTEADPIKIGSIQELKAVANGLDKYYVLTNDIDLGADTTWIPLGRSTAHFTGSLDGQGYRITNLRSAAPADYFGLFAYATDARIKNLILEDVNIKGTDHIAALVAVSAGTTEISNCSVSGQVQGTGSYIGGLVSYMTGESTIKNSQMAGTVSGSNYIGGLVGRLNSGEIFQSTNAAEVIAAGNDWGEIAGKTDQNGRITECETTEPTR